MPWAYFITIHTGNGPIKTRLQGELNEYEREQLLQDGPVPAGICERYYHAGNVADLALFPIALGSLAQPRLGQLPNHAGDVLTVREAFRQARNAEALARTRLPAPRPGRGRR